MSEIVSETIREITPSGAGHYTILSLIKAGRRSSVYLAAKAGKRFVLKTASTDSGRDLELLRREWEMSIGLSHPGLCYVFTWEEDTPVGPSIVQEWVDGVSLADYLKEKPSLKERKRVFAQLLSVVSYLHGKGIIHNDLSPSNILITRADRNVKIIDLGFADDDMHISAKALGGTRNYASPELLSGGLVDARSDIWTLGSLIKDIFPHRYCRLVWRCHRHSPGRRYGSVDALERAWRGYWKPLWLTLAFLALIGMGLFLRSYTEMRSKFKKMDALRIEELSAVSRQLDSLRNESEERMNEFAAVSHELDSLKKAEAEQAKLLSAAKAKVDAFYATKIPAFRKALRNATTRDDVFAAWATLADSMTYVNNDIPASVPESLRGDLRDYIFERYNTTFPKLQNEMIARINEL